MPKEMEKIIISCYKELCQKCNASEIAVSTRSAGVVSHPGQYETYLNVIGELEVTNKIKSVWGARSILVPWLFEAERECLWRMTHWYSGAKNGKCSRRWSCFYC